MKLLRVLFAILTFVILEGCQHDPWADRFLTRQASEQDVGLYVVDQASRQRTIKQPMSRSPLKINPSARIVLHADHSAEFSYVPEQLIDGVSCSASDGRGSWRLGRTIAISPCGRSLPTSSPTIAARRPWQRNSRRNSNCMPSKPPYKLHVTLATRSWVTRSSLNAAIKKR